MDRYRGNDVDDGDLVDWLCDSGSRAIAMRVAFVEKWSVDSRHKRRRVRAASREFRCDSSYYVNQ